MHSVGETQKFNSPRMTRKQGFIKVVQRRDGVYLKEFTGVRHAGKGFIFIPNEVLTEVINHLVDVETEVNYS